MIYIKTIDEILLTRLIFITPIKRIMKAIEDKIIIYKNIKFK